MTAAGSDPSSSLDRLLARCAERVRFVARSHRLDPSTVGEVFQEVRIRIWKAFGGSEKIAELPASYVYQTASAAAIDLMRRRRARRADVTDPLESQAGERVTVEGPGLAALEAQELGTQVDAALADLVPSRRPVVRMHLEGYDRHEIAALLGWSEAKVRNLLYRGMDDLRGALRRRGIGPEGGAR
jgi:RNA polymerase sigma factor (sigma-70 family)